MYDGAFYRTVDRFALEYHNEEFLLKYADIFDELNVSYRILRVEFPKSDAYTIEILPEGDSLLSKYLRRTKVKEKGIKIVVSDFFDGSETLATFNRARNWIILEEGFIDLINSRDKDNWIPFLSHEIRHALFQKKRVEKGFLGYGSEIINDGKKGETLYDVYLSAEESYNYVKQFQSHLARYYNAKRSNDVIRAVNMMDSMESAADFGRENIQRFIDIYEKAFLIRPKLKLMKDGRQTFLVAEFSIEDEVLNVPIKNVQRSFELKEGDLHQWQFQINNALNENLEIFRGDLSRLNQMALDSGLGI